MLLQPHQEQLIDLTEFARRLGVTKRTVRRLEQNDPSFPRRIQKTRKVFYWLRAEVERYLGVDGSETVAKTCEVANGEKTQPALGRR
jgi:predicted DNA-binding transcriptional regulator AlpA